MLRRIALGLTFAVVGALLLLDAWDVVDLPAAAVPAVLLVGLGASLIVGSERGRGEG